MVLPFKIITPLQQYFDMVLFIKYVVLTFEFVDEILWGCHSNKTFLALLSHSTIWWTKSYGVTIFKKISFL